MSNPKWVTIALAEMGQKEIAGPASNPRILQYHAVTTLGAKSDEVAWCASFVSWVLKEAALPSVLSNGRGSARAADFATYGTKLEKPVLGAIVVFSRVGGNHVGFYMGEDKGKWLILGGNQGNQVCIERYGLEKLIAIRWPAGVPLPNAIAPLSTSGVIRGNVVTGLATVGSLGAGLVGSADTVDKARSWIAEGGWIAITFGILALVGVVWSILSRVKGRTASGETPTWDVVP
ncbi:TIGR02594 family protein [Roseococcus pinisoli]|uniref:TIGR02594 family protein n=1 Tax=Roseococcus pinisoli TaxID=2835040 RepID=A0ABS5QF61_9PROT|nr:TIGR02594 family protein [Roseococcus pinisoli]MBS7812335.1 TIGR02594 family protein [Roseococcus pinisoli]